mmetsp:Transcript_70863/g.200804  ORF Transcript_70863/g.200804 Transcript_70863/m.200804 type:complete len:505 (+) Transcript_70863:2013-3527(+)
MAVAAASDSAMVSVASLMGKNSSPLRKGSSALFTFSSAVSTSSTFLRPSLTYASESTRSRWSFVAASTLLSFSCAFLLLSTSFWSPAFTAGTAPGRCAWMQLTDAFSDFCELTTALPISWMASSESSSPSAQPLAVFSTLSTSASACLMRSSSSSSTVLPLMSLVPDSEAFLPLATSDCAWLIRPCSFAIATASSPPLDSFCLAAMSFRASRHAEVASFSATALFSTASCSSSVDTSSRVSERKTCDAFTMTWDLASAPVMASMRSARRAPIFRSSVSALKVANFLAASSHRCMSRLSSSMVDFADSFWVLLLASATFCRMKALAPVTTFSAAPPAASHSLMAFVDSSCGRTSIPFRNGISASPHFCRTASTCSDLSMAMATICCMAMPSFCLRRTVVTPSSFFFAARPCSLSLFSSSFRTLSVIAALIFSSRVLNAAVMAVWAGVTIFSAEATSSSDICPCSAALLMRLAFSTSSSAASIFSVISTSAFFASTRDLYSLRNVL